MTRLWTWLIKVSKDFKWTSGSKNPWAQNMAKLWICLNKSEYALTMSQYRRIYLNIGEYDWICRNIPEEKKQNTDYARILDLSDAVHSIGPLYKLLSSYEKTYLEHCQIFKIEHFVEIIMAECRCATINLSWQVEELGAWTVCETRALHKHFIEKHKKKRFRRKSFYKFFSWILLKLIFESNIQPKDGNNQGLSFQNQETFSDF